MPRKPRLRVADIPFHVIQRGNNRSACFYRDDDYHRYLEDLRTQARSFGVAVHAYVLMTNHTHLLMTSSDADGISLTMKFLGQRYVQYVNRTYQRTGSLWEGRFRSCLVDRESYFLICHRYIECNPVRAGMVEHPSDYRWSSFRANALGLPDTLITPHPCVLALGTTSEDRRAAYHDLFRDELGADVLDQIRSSTNGGFALGCDRFKEELARRLGRHVERQKRGPKPRPALDSNQSALLPPVAPRGS